MKTGLLTAALLMGFASQSFAEFRAGADQKYVTILCTRLQPVPDMGLQVTVTEGGFAPITEVTVDRSFLGKTYTKKYVVERVQNDRIGAPVTYKGDGLTLSVNFSVAPLDDGGQHGILSLEDGDGKYSSREELRCTSVMHTM